MFVPESSEAALPMMFLLWCFWGSWPLARKQGGSGNAEFGLTYVFAQFLVTVLLCCSMGMANPQSTRHFDSRVFTEVLADELEHKAGAVLLSCFAGAILCLGDFLMACAIDVFGVVVACPVGFGIALTAGTTLNYVIEPRADPQLLFPGVACCLLGMLCNTASLVGKEHRDSSSIPEGSSKADADVEITVVSVDGATLEATTTDPAPKVNSQEVAVVVSSEEALAGQETRNTKLKWYFWLLPLIGGSCCASFGPITTAAATFGKLDPYAVYFAFMAGQLVTVLPMISVYSTLSGLSGEVSTIKRIWQAPCLVLKSYVDSRRKSPRGLAWNCLAGFATGSGYFFFFVGSPVVSRAVGFIFGCSGLLLSIFFGVFVFKEYHGASCRQKSFVAFATAFLVFALGLMSVAGKGD